MHGVARIAGPKTLAHALTSALRNVRWIALTQVGDSERPMHEKERQLHEKVGERPKKKDLAEKKEQDSFGVLSNSWAVCLSPSIFAYRLGCLCSGR